MQALNQTYPGKTVDDCQIFDLREYSALTDLRHGSDLIVVCFANQPMSRHAMTPADHWGHAFMAGRGLDHICLAGRVETWFRSDIVGRFLRSVTEALPHQRILTYGISKGGTGALWHASSARATEVFTCVPQTLPDANALARGDDRWPSASFHDWPQEDLARGLAEVAKVTVLTDRCNAFEVAYLADITRNFQGMLQVVDMPYAGHDGAAMMGRHHALSRLFDGVVQGGIDLVTAHQLTGCRKSEPGYYLNLLAKARVARSSRLKSIVAAAAKARGIDPASVRMDSGYRKLRRLGRY